MDPPPPAPNGSLTDPLRLAAIAKHIEDFVSSSTALISEVAARLGCSLPEIRAAAQAAELSRCPLDARHLVPAARLAAHAHRCALRRRHMDPRCSRLPPPPFDYPPALYPGVVVFKEESTSGPPGQQPPSRDLAVGGGRRGEAPGPLATWRPPGHATAPPEHGDSGAPMAAAEDSSGGPTLRVRALEERQAAAARARAARPAYRPLPDGDTWPGGSASGRPGQQGGRGGSEQEKMAAERDYKRRRIKYRTHAQRTPTTVLRDIIDATMAELAEAAGQGAGRPVGEGAAGEERGPTP